MSKKINQFKYQIKEHKNDSDKTIILKTGIAELKAEFSLNEIKEDIKRINQKKTELEAKKELAESVIKNVVLHNPDVEKLDEKMRIAAFLYEEKTQEVKMMKEILDKLYIHLDNYAKEMEEITKQTGLCLKENQ